MTIFIFDWDDTLFPTTWSEANYKKKGDPWDPYQKEIFSDLEYLDYQVWKILHNFSKKGDVYIISGSLSGWIDTCLKYLPRTRQFIYRKEIPTIHTGTGGSSIDKEKLILQKEIHIKNLFDTIEHKERKVYSFGDRDTDAISVLRIREDAYTLKLPEAMYPCCLAGHLRYIRKNIDNGELDLQNLSLACRNESSKPSSSTMKETERSPDVEEIFALDEEGYDNWMLVSNTELNKIEVPL